MASSKIRDIYFNIKSKWLADSVNKERWGKEELWMKLRFGARRIGSFSPFPQLLFIFKWMMIYFKHIENSKNNIRNFQWTSVLCLVAQLCLTLCDPMDCILPASSVLGDFPGKSTGVVALPYSRESSQPRDQTHVPTLQADSLLSEPPGFKLELTKI